MVSALFIAVLFFVTAPLLSYVPVSIDTLLAFDWLLAPLTLLLAVPGLLLLIFLKRYHHFHVLESVGIVSAASLVAFPLLFVWTSALNLRLTPFAMYVLLAIALTVLVMVSVRQRAFFVMRVNVSPTTALGFAVVVVLIALLRFLNIRDLALPLWVDSVHHSAIARLIATQGALPDSYRPFADVDHAYYHMGFHTLVVALAWLTRWDIEHAMLLLGQVLNVLVCVTLYILASRWWGRAVAGLTAMVVVGTLSLMPAYYVTWGRYTQLAGLVVLPIAMLSWQWALEQGAKRLMILAAVLTAGLIVVHIRVALLLATFVMASLLWDSLVAFYRRKPFGARWLRAIWGALTTALICAPWLWRLLNDVVLPLDTFFSRIAGDSDYNSIPWDLVTFGHYPELLVLSSIGLLLGLLQRRGFVIVILLWLILSVVIVNPILIGSSPTWIFNNFSLAITLFIPLSLLVGLFVSSGLQLIETHLRRVHVGRMNTLVSFALVLIALWSAHDIVNIVNPVTILATSDDVSAMDWVQTHTTPDATFLINARLWQGVTYAGTDGGYWIQNLTGRRTTMPIAMYVQGIPDYMRHINQLAARIESAPDPDDTSFLAMLRARDVTYVYIGAKGGPLPLDKFLSSAHYHEVYAHNAVHIFSVLY